MVARVTRNDWSTVPVPDLSGWRPSRIVSVIIPAYRSQATLDLTLASLSEQTYPEDLLEVVVVDDRSDPPLSLPAVRPRRTTLVRVEEGWGRANALAWGVRHSEGEILHWLDADMVVYPEHVAAQARWQHALPYAVTLGYKRFVDPETHGPWPSAEAVVKAWRSGGAADLFGGDEGEPHTYVERYVNQTDQLRTADHLTFRIHVGATAALTRDLYESAGGFDRQLRLGEDTEFGYRLGQAGAVFVPVPEARSWHLGRTHVMKANDQVTRYNRPFLADRVPYPRHWRRTGGTFWSVPLAEVAMPVEGEPLERVRAAVDSVLRGTERDVRVSLVGPWDRLDGRRVPVLTDPDLDLRLVAATYRGEPRVRLVTGPVSAFPAAFLLELPAPYALAPDALRGLTDVSDRHQAGLVRVEPPEAADGAAAAGGAPIVLWRTAAVSRARWVRAEGESLADAVTALFGRRELTARAAGVLAVSPSGAVDPGSGSGWGSGAGTARRRAAFVPTTVEVEGVRSLAKATVTVAWLTGRRLKSRFGR